MLPNGIAPNTEYYKAIDSAKLLPNGIAFATEYYKATHLATKFPRPPHRVSDPVCKDCNRSIVLGSIWRCRICADMLCDRCANEDLVPICIECAWL